MKRYTLNVTLLPLALVCLCAIDVRAQEPKAGPAAQNDAQQASALTKNAQAFVDAFEKGDAKAVAAFWAENGDYVDLTGHRLQGRPAIEDAFKDFFAENKGSKLRIDVNSVRFVTPDTAIEDGITSVTSPDGGPPNKARYTDRPFKKRRPVGPAERARGALQPAG